MEISKHTLNKDSVVKGAQPHAKQPVHDSAGLDERQGPVCNAISRTPPSRRAGGLHSQRTIARHSRSAMVEMMGWKDWVLLERDSSRMALKAKRILTHI